MITNFATGGKFSQVKVAPVAHGLMMMTWTSKPIPDEQCFEAMSAGMDQLPADTKMILNSGEFYAQDLGTGNLEMLSRFFERYPEYTEKAFLSVKGGTIAGTLEFDGSEPNIRRSVDAILNALRGKKSLDLFECARVPKNNGIENVMEILMKLVEEGKFDYIGMSECGEETLRRAAKVAPIMSVEIEVSLWSYEEETKKVIAAAKDLGIMVHGYSPIGRGLLSGSLKSRGDLPDGDVRLHFTRFSEDNFPHNLTFVSFLMDLAKRKTESAGTMITPAQLAIAWVRSLGDHVVPLPGSSKKERTLENLLACDVVLTDEDKKEILEMLEQFKVQGGRYVDGVKPMNDMLWG